ncbi:MAG: transcription elongation factor Spt5 [Candidatus Bathyarchaeota archaeon]
MNEEEKIKPEEEKIGEVEKSTVESAKEVQVKKSQIYVVKTTSGQENNVANLVLVRASSQKLPIYAILTMDRIKGCIFIEAAGPHFVDEVASGIKHVKQRLPGIVNISDVEKFLIVKPTIEELNLEDVVEVVSGPFKGMRAKVTRIDKPKNEVTLELLEATITFPITIRADHVRLVSKGEGEKKVG